MKVVVIMEFSADGYVTEKGELECLSVMLEELDSTAVSVKVHSIEVMRE